MHECDITLLVRRLKSNLRPFGAFFRILIHCVSCVEKRQNKSLWHLSLAVASTRKVAAIARRLLFKTEDADSFRDSTV